MSSIDWGDVLRGSLSLFLILAGVGILFVCIKLGGLLARLGRTVGSMTDEIVPILTRAQGTVDGINLELARVDEIMVTAVNATKGAEKTVSTLSHVAVAPVKKASGLAAAAKEALATFRARRQAGPDEADVRAAAVAEPAPPEPSAVREEYVAQATALREETAAAAHHTPSYSAPAASVAEPPPAPAAPVADPPHVAAAPVVPPPAVAAPPARASVAGPAPSAPDASSVSPAAAPVAAAEVPPPSPPAPHVHAAAPVPTPPSEPVAAAPGRSTPPVPERPRRGPNPSMIEWALPKKDPSR